MCIRDRLKAAGVNAVWDFDSEAGTGFAKDVISRLEDNLILKND